MLTLSFKAAGDRDAVRDGIQAFVEEALIEPEKLGEEEAVAKRAFVQLLNASGFFLSSTEPAWPPALPAFRLSSTEPALPALLMRLRPHDRHRPKSREYGPEFLQRGVLHRRRAGFFIVFLRGDAGFFIVSSARREAAPLLFSAR